MIKKKASVILMVDTEGEFGRIAFSAKTTLSYKIKMFISYLLKLDYSIKTLKNMIAILKKHKFPATFFFVGALYLKKQDKKFLREYLKTKPETKYLFRKKLLLKIIPAWGDYIEKNMKNNLLEAGIHNFLHESNFLESDKQIAKSLQKTIEAARKLGLNPKTYAAPWFEQEEQKQPRRIYKILKKEGIICTRFDGIRKKGNKRVTFERKIMPLFTRYGLKCTHSSYFIKDGKIDRNEYKTIKKGIEQAIKDNSVFAISTHDTTFLRHGTKHFENIIKLINSYKEKINITTLSELTKNVRN